MSIHVALHHRTSYRYDRLVVLAPQVVRLRPAAHTRTAVLSYSLKVEPSGHFINWQQDPHGNYLARLVFPERTDRFTIEVDLVADMAVINPFDFFLEPTAEQVPFGYEPWLMSELRPYLEVEPAGTRLQALIATIDRQPKATASFLVELNQRLQGMVRYLIRMEPGVQTCEQTLELGSGSCRDSAWLMVQLLRNLGLAARFVSGYLIQLTPDVKSLDGPSGPERDFTDLHAWAEVYLPGAGWVGLDPTSGLLAGEGHIPLACTPDPFSAAPISGSVEHCESTFEFGMSVRRLVETPRVTKPYSEEQWQTIEALGHVIDERLVAGDVRLTMGGEPTFVSIDDMDGPEWTVAAIGPRKRELASTLLLRLRERFAKGALLHFGQGKWYPGEPLPRWALSCIWRRDGEPLWRDPALLGDGERDHGHDAATARRFAEVLGQQLGVETRWLMPAYEDVWTLLDYERQLPVDADPSQADLDAPAERQRLARALERGVGGVVGYVLPLERQWWQGRATWGSGPWPLRTEHLMLIPGESPIGLRLPLDSLPSRAAGSFDVQPRDPLMARPPLPQHPGYRARPDAGAIEGVEPSLQLQYAVGDAAADVRLGTGVAADAGAPNVVRTAICFEPRGGQVHVFMPPLPLLEDYLELVVAIESTASELKMPVVIEGYQPPADPRLEQIKVTPDPGVIEVNIHPAHNWDELVEHTTALYEEAALSRLGTEKFQLDGKHSGTGGGNHVVLGGPTAADSPFLRRPDLLRSFLAYWNNHPSLSYLFSGTFIGPTSQAPRVDEGRRDALYELQLAFEQIPERGACPPWLVDRVFRHLLTDGTGNTHRAEFCIDKLYSPDSVTGRLGLVELRALEMPPHARMSLTQQLLIRAFVVRFWEQPYLKPLIDWGTALHDRFMLPAFIAADFTEVIEETRAAGLDLQAEWFAPHIEFRFPRIGGVEQRGIEIELRSALEPWYVLGEEPVGGLTARFVDSSVERLQVLVRGTPDARYVVACNGRLLPLTPTGTVGELVAGVRYRAWQPPHCLHPTIGVHTPLVFDLLDTWNGRSVGGCTYHVAHPGGRNFETFPVNAYEAEARRGARFFVGGHTGGSMSTPPAERNVSFPVTLDLRTSAAGAVPR